jgi:hypothetical protein
MDTLIVGLCTVAGVALAMGITRLGLEFIIQIIPAREDTSAAARRSTEA